MRKGSSPLTRGKPNLPVNWVCCCGLIPAHAGKTSYLDQRGKLCCWFVRLLRIGLIPAHAGKTLCLAFCLLVVWAHPRSRGENKFPGERREYGYGSSPLTRGKPSLPDGERTGGGLIPAHAGKTGPRARSPRHRRAHPRSRGENLAPQGGAHPQRGSSPLTRGKHTRRRR